MRSSLISDQYRKRKSNKVPTYSSNSNNTAITTTTVNNNTKSTARTTTSATTSPSPIYYEDKERVVSKQVPQNRREEIYEYLKLFGYKPDSTIIQVHITGFFKKKKYPPRELERYISDQKIWSYNICDSRQNT